MDKFVPASEPLVDTLAMKDALAGISDKRGKIARLIRSGELIRLRRGLYATRPDLNPLGLAASIYGPSYISFETALAYHGLIPEVVFEITSATPKRPVEFINRFGRYRYRRVPESVYPIGTVLITETECPFPIASPTKALCDRIALEPRIRSMVEVLRWIDLMRLDDDIRMDLDVLGECARRYRSSAVRFLWRAASRLGGYVRDRASGR